MIHCLLLILINVFSLILNQTCGVKDPKSLEECLVHSSTNSKCCYAKIQIKTRNDTLCIFVPNSQIFITPHIRSLDIGLNDEDIEIELNCGFDPSKLKDGEPYSYCGESPKNPYDCIQNSYPHNSCCYIRNPMGESFCVLNNGIYNSNSTYFGVNIVCQEKYIKINLFVLFFIFISFLI